MFFTTVGILACIAIGVALLYLTYHSFERWRCFDGSAIGFVIRIFPPLILAIVVLYLTFAHAPVRIITG